jgi:filamentous hemagglutinin
MSRTPPAAPLPKIRGTQIGLKKPWLVDQIKADMRAGRYAYEEPRGQIGGVQNRHGRYYVVEGHHRMAAALEIYCETGDQRPVRELLRCGRWVVRDRGPTFSRPLPSRRWWGAFRNWIGL